MVLADIRVAVEDQAPLAKLTFMGQGDRGRCRHRLQKRGAPRLHEAEEMDTNQMV